MSKEINTYGLFFRAVEAEASNPGDEYDLYANAHIGKDEKGNPCVISDGKVNIREMIQKSKPESIAELLIKFTQTGDSSLFNQKPSLGYLDNTVLPQSKEDLLDLPKKLQTIYEHLDPAIKGKFVDYDQFANSIIDGNIYDILSKTEEVKEEMKEEVKDNG